jgi:serine/threonine protein kinase
MEICINEIFEHSKYEIPKNYDPIRKIGKGSFGRVIEVLEKTTKTKYAMKIINKDSKKFYKYNTVKDEVNILKNLSHPNIIKYYDFQESVTKLYIIMELAEGESLFEWINNHYRNNKNYIIDNEQTIDESKIYIIIKQLLSAINYLHSHNICHRDIKPQNILLSKKGEINNIKLIDFGLSVNNFQNIGENKICGTWAYMSPEMLFNHKYYKPIDLWAVGIIMYELLNNGEHPFYKFGMTKKELLKNIKNINISYNNNISPLANNLLQQLLQKDLSLRITASLALKHP